jgi:hypothetical protein
MSNRENIDIILQGPYTDFTDEIVSHYLELPFVSKIIISCWEGSVPSTNGNYVENKSQVYDHERVECVRSIDNLNYSGVLNVNYQLVTSLAGVEYSKNDLCAKFRTDQKYTHEAMASMYEFFIKNIHTSKPEINFLNQDKTAKGKIFIAGNFYKVGPFSLRDWLYWGYREDLINLFDAPFQVNEQCRELKVDKQKCESNGEFYFKLFTTPETYIGAYYCSRFDKRVIEMVNNQSEYLYASAPNEKYAFSVSEEILPKLFKSFPRTNMNMIWPKNNIWHFPISLYHEIWHEEGM